MVVDIQIRIPLPQVVDAAGRIDWLPAKGFHQAYRQFLRHFAEVEVFNSRELIVGASMVYSWMPTILRLHLDEVGPAASAVQAARNGRTLGAEEIGIIAGVVNNSVVGTSKLLHFANPGLYPILDSKVFAFLRSHGKAVGYITDPRFYVAFAAACRDAVVRPEFRSIQEIATGELGFEVAPLRALELVMFLIGDGDLA